MEEQTLKLKKSGNQHWDTLADMVAGEVGTVSGSFTTSGQLYYSAVFSGFGAELTWIPEFACELSIP